eukprot:gnl/TRDRNA2_/TRDRNA2_137419_c0_seq1.p1 gnl/TRDRNA2_/TRDRNA2_137419_c0~~gnl/TRDRNA2_/TRDRNA2_137419_c0_seq1.p1  ORF type:complete len:350 (+),score=38.55 gnl/TRDRNA2_/TRDRNA2_137419_c0_seq1:1-1050(+)
MLARSGAGVVIACHGDKDSDFDEVESQLTTLGLLRGAGEPEKGWIQAWPLELESFASVRTFATRVTKEMGTLNILVHNAATKEGCGRTEDGHELTTQVNYLSPFLLTQLLLPMLHKVSARVVHVTCDAGLQLPDWLPWPLRRTDSETLPRIDLESLEQRQEGEDSGATAADCSPLVQYANSKLALLAHSHELNRRTFVVSHAINPGPMDSKFGHSASVPPGKPSTRGSMMSKLPPVWIANQIYAHTVGPTLSSFGNSVLRHTLRTSHAGASAVFHVATSLDLGDEEHGGGLFSDTAGAFINCGKPPEECGRIQAHRQPAAAADEELAVQLWDATEGAIGPEHLRPVRGE